MVLDVNLSFVKNAGWSFLQIDCRKKSFSTLKIILPSSRAWKITAWVSCFFTRVLLVKLMNYLLFFLSQYALQLTEIWTSFLGQDLRGTLQIFHCYTTSGDVTIVSVISVECIWSSFHQLTVYNNLLAGSQQDSILPDKHQNLFKAPLL